MKNPKLKYNLWFCVGILCVLNTVVCLVLLANNFDSYNSIQRILLFIGACTVFLLKPIDRIMKDWKLSAEYDEFGMKKKQSRFDFTKDEQRQIDMNQTANMERIIGKSTLKSITKQGSKNPEKDLNELIGLAPVKDKVNEMVARMKFERTDLKKKGSNNALSGRHMVFYGSPGTGKTTVARIITGFLYKYGYIKENKVIEVDGNFLKAGSLGDTTIKTKVLIRQAYGGVLFIDEAYSLGESEFGEQAIATLIKEMEDNRDKFIIILAGYTENMKELIKTNPGFASRIKEYISFPDYDETEMRQIFLYMAGQQNFAIDQDTYDVFDVRISKESPLMTFGNARTVRSILDEAIDLHALNYINKKIDASNKFKLMPCDIKPTPKEIF